MGRALGGREEQGDRQKRLAVRERQQRWAERRQTTLCFRNRQGAIVGQVAVFNNDKDHRKAKYYKDRIFTIGFSSLVLKNKIHLSKFEDVIGFLKRFMSWTASHLATRRALMVVQMGGF